MRISLEQGPLCTFIIRSDAGQTRLIQVDTDFLGVADTFGWDRPRVDTPDAIGDAYSYLAEHVGTSTDDPGYF